MAQRTRIRPISLGTAIAVAAALAMVPLGTAAAEAAPSSAGSGGNVIVVLKDQHTNLAFTHGAASSPRGKAFASDQSGLIKTARGHGVKNARGFTAVNAVAATVTSAQEAQLATDPDVAQIFPDLPIKPPAISAPTAAATQSPSAPRTAASAQQVCPASPSSPLLEPEALGLTHTAYSNPKTPQAQNIVTGAGIKVAFIADGLDIDNPDFVRPDGSHVFVDYKDFSGDGLAAPTGGAEAFGDASEIAAQGRESYDLSNFVNATHPLPAGCDIQIRGVAPGASLIGLKVFNNEEQGAPTSHVIEAIDYAVSAGADVLNESIGSNPYPDTGDNPISLADQAAIAAGVTVVASSGDGGVTGTTDSPSTAAGVIGVGATTAMQVFFQEGYPGIGLSNGIWSDNGISTLSSGGISEAGRTPDLVAPGDSDWALCTPDATLYADCIGENGNPSSVQNFVGTSASAPLAAGAAALVIAAYEKTHHGGKPTPAVVKQILTGTATDLGIPAYEQGAGELNTLKAVQAAENWTSGPVRGGRGTAAAGSALAVTQTQLSAAAYPGTRVAQRLTVTNVGRSAQFVSASTRALGATVSDAHGSATLDAATAPTFFDVAGVADSYVPVTFTVAPHVDHLTFTAAGPTAQSSAEPAVILINPAGQYSAYSEPQGLSNVGRDEITEPMAGKWTAYIGLSQSAAFDGTFQWEALEQRFTAQGSVSPAFFALAPGSSRTVTVSSSEPLAPGDLSASVQLKGSAAGVTSVPFSLRAVVPPANYSFSGAILGGNGDTGFVGAAQVYYLDVPRGRRDLGVGITVGDTADTLLATLTGPDGQTYSWNSNAADGKGIQDYVHSPAAGRWHLTVETLDPVSGLETQSAYHVSVRYNTVSVSAPSLPNSASTTLAQGTPVTVPVTVRNTGAATLSYFADARLDQTGTIPLTDLGSSATFPLPEPADVTPEWIVPSHSTAFSVTATADQPVSVDTDWQGGDPEAYAASPGGNTTTDSYTADQVTPGIWAGDIEPTGPFDGPAPAGTVTVSATATGQLFDTDVTSPTGDFYTEGVVGQPTTAPVDLTSTTPQITATEGAPLSDLPPTPLADGVPTLAPGQSATFLVTITPSAAKGSIVRGTLYIDTLDPGLLNADELTALPYSYRVG